jgi:hypothetical protein
MRAPSLRTAALALLFSNVSLRNCVPCVSCLSSDGALILCSTDSISIYCFVTAAASQPASGGEAAQRISNSCFAALMLTNSFSQMLNVSDRLSLLAGLTARIHQLAEVLSAP